MKAKFIISKSIVLNKYYQIEKLCDLVSYSSKTNPLITSLLEENTDSIFSIHLFNELKDIKDKSRVLFLAQAWNNKKIKKLLDLGVKRFVIDNETDLNTFLEYIETNQPQGLTLLLRMKLKENTLKTERYFVFGINSDKINQRIKEICSNQKQKSSISNIGIHFHRKTQNMAEWNLRYELEDLITPEVMSLIDFINIGGGLPSEYANTNVNVLPSIFKKINEFKSWAHQQDVKIMIEPGRFIAAPAGKLITEIIGIDQNNITINASVYNCDLDALIVPVKLKVENELTKETGEPFVIKGITPCSMDLFRYRVYLNNPKIGDFITFINAGAYNFTTEFCNLEKLDTEIIE